MATLTDPGDITRHENLFARLQDIASSGPAARTILGRIAADYRKL